MSRPRRNLWLWKTEGSSGGLWYDWYRVLRLHCVSSPEQRPVYGLFMDMENVAPLFIKMFDRNAYALPNRNYCYMYCYSVCACVFVCVCARINQRKWVWPTFTQLSGHQGPRSSCFPAATVACVWCMRDERREGNMLGTGRWTAFFGITYENSQKAWFKKLLMWHMVYMEKVFVMM